MLRRGIERPAAVPAPGATDDGSDAAVASAEERVLARLRALHAGPMDGDQVDAS